MDTPHAITIRLDTVDQLLERCPPSPFRRRQLRQEAEKFLVERVMALPRGEAARLVIVLPADEAAEADRLVQAIHGHFNFLRVEAERKLERMWRVGWRSLGIAVVLLAAAMLLVQLMQRALPTGPLSSIAIEGVTILAWVALWGPGQLLLYDRYPLQRDRRLFAKLEHSEIRVTFEQDVWTAEGNAFNDQ